MPEVTLNKDQRKRSVDKLKAVLENLGKATGSPAEAVKNEAARTAILEVLSMIETEQEKEGREQAAGA